MRFPPHILDEIRERVPISTVIGRRVTWDQRKSQPAKGDYWACCPFHNEKTPSFHCDDRRQRYHCFGCGATGDIFRFLTEREGYPFPEAVEELAGQAGVVLPKPDPKMAAQEAERASLADWVEAAAKFYEANLRSAAGRSALEYAQHRGFREALLLRFRFGYALNERDALLRFLTAKGATVKELADAGLITIPEDGRKPYDRMRDRLIIPICDRRGRVIGFGGRTLSADREPKYLNSPETSLFSKRRMLFNWHQAREPAHQSGQIIVVEGYLDAVAVAQAGIEAVVAALGTAFTEEQISALWQLAEEPTLCFDGDKAGRAAAFRAIDRMLPVLSAGKSFRFTFLPEGQDPDDLIKASGPDAFLDEIRAAKPLHEVLWERETEGTQLDTPERRANLEQRIDALIDQIQDPRVAKAYRFTLRLKVSDLFRSLPDRPKAASSATAAAAASARLKRPIGIDAPKFSISEDRTERALLGLCVHVPEFLDEHLERIMRIEFSSNAFNQFRDSLHSSMSDPRQPGEAGPMASNFGSVLSEVYGDNIDGERQPTALYAVLPVLAIGPPQHLIQQLFECLLSRLELRDMRREYDEEVRSVGDHLFETDEMRLIALLRDIQKRGEELDRQEQAISDHLRMVRKSGER